MKNKTLSILHNYIFKPINESHKEFYLWMALRVVFYISALFSPIILGDIVNELTDKNYQELPYLIGLYAFFVIVLGVFLELLTARGIYFTAFKVFKDASYKNFYKRIRNTNTQFWQEHGKGKIIKILGDANVNATWLTAGFAHSTLWNIFSAFGSLVTVIIYDIRFSYVFVIGGVLQMINMIVLSTKEKQKLKETNKELEKGSKIITEYINNFTNVFYLNLFDKVENSIDKNANDYFGKYKKRENTTMLKWLFNNLVANLIEVIVIIIAVFEIVNGRMELGSLVVVTTFAARYSGGLGGLLINYQSVLEKYVYIERFDEVMGHLENNYSRECLEKINEFESLKLENITLTTSNGVKSVNNISFEIKKGEKVAIIGSSGGGKSTLISMILKSLNNFEGKISINGIDYGTIDETQITNLYSVVPQEVQLFQDSIRNNIVIGKAGKDTDIDMLSKQTELDRMISRLDDGFDTILSESSINISGGERQRIGIARAIAQDTPILILDEATASLDPKTELNVVKNIVNDYNDKTLVFVTHKYGMLSLFDKIIVLNEGKLIESGSFEELYNRGGMFKELVDSFNV